MKYVLTILSLLAILNVKAQVNIKVFVADSISGTPVIQAYIYDSITKKGAITNIDGLTTLSLNQKGITRIHIKAITYAPKSVQLMATKDTFIALNLIPLSQNINEIIVESFRTQSRLEDNPTKIEVLGYEEMQEEGAVQPGGISGMLSDFSGTQIQQISSINGNSVLRMQGLDGRYTQFLQDGMPLFGGWSGSYNLLSIPPADLKQIELIKGASSTLYGNGAVAGILNLVSKTPILFHPEHSVLLNQTSLGETNFNTFHAWRNKNWGYTLFAGGTFQQARDIDGDGYADAAYTHSLFIHPTWFKYFNSHTTLSISYNFMYDNDRGGAINAVTHNDSTKGYLVTNTLQRHNLYASYKEQYTTHTFNLKAATSLFDRGIQVGGQRGGVNNLTYYSEATFTLPRRKMTWLLGAAVNGVCAVDNSLDKGSASRYNTMGLFTQNDWVLTKKWTMQTGLRVDEVIDKKLFPLPQVAVLYKASKNLLFRLSGGLGYKMPAVGDYLEDERDILNRNLVRFYSANLNAEQSASVNADINYTFRAGDDMVITINEDVFYTYLNNPNMFFDTLGTLEEPIQSIGQEFWLRAKSDDLELYAGYTYTDARRLNAPIDIHLPLISPHKAAAVATYDLWKEKFRLGLEASYTGYQYRDNETRTPGYWTFAASLMLKLKKLTLVINGENLTNYRQQNIEQIVLPPSSSPLFKPIWASIEGRVLNVSVQWKW